MPVQSFMHRVEGIDWYCQQQGEGPTIVLVPSGEGDCTSFDAVAAQLADDSIAPQLLVLHAAPFVKL